MNALGQNGRMPAIAEPAERFIRLTRFRFEATGASPYRLALLVRQATGKGHAVAPAPQLFGNYKHNTRRVSLLLH